MLLSFVTDYQQRSVSVYTYCQSVMKVAVYSSATLGLLYIHVYQTRCLVVRLFEAFVSLSVPKQASSEEAPLLTGSSLDTVQRLWYTRGSQRAGKLIMVQ